MVQYLMSRVPSVRWDFRTPLGAMAFGLVDRFEGLRSILRMIRIRIILPALRSVWKGRVFDAE
ncbi:MAG: hypothetical protein BGN99_07815 [Alphaproteobacteria bacterium 65-37]|nr:MAG: hypothetical protein BGN99_07815 [Alphaproteobacteria bacterium 65-37]